MEIRIEHGTDADLDVIEQLYNDLLDVLETGMNYPGWKRGIYPTRKDALTGIVENSLFVARSGDSIVGAFILNHKPENGYDNAKWLYGGDYSLILVVHTLVVHPAFMNRGIGLQLLRFAEKWGKQNGMKAIRLDVYENNVPAIALYERCGYQYIQSIDLGFGHYGLDLFKLYEKLLSDVAD
ncbi:GNAT family N-acetyltransferase [Murimonas intestini]|uniref:Acetyltransferase (GNAT) family protein n=1 Tax=Murimonas intestini TaxID=1337051 RepID=A0AB73T8L9_9FIRM|nr:GNAT family N-acetyltransferase [Murimonas intestini]MCR1839919.1 GNAT family N-acetyltransferase [Murimonas intestini]MCR1866759.1 GNAT family N-acetyltransferase [Murimonas intestini]MCR1883592.1 GNAT family N-acetyltransferase [Murimonas intestini]